MRRKERFGKHGKYQSQRLIEGFYYSYLHPEEVGDRSKGWLMMAHDPFPKTFEEQLFEAQEKE